MSKFIEKHPLIAAMLFITIIFILFKVFIGSIEINGSVPYNNPIYKLFVNDKMQGLTMSIKKKRTLIPSTLYYSSSVDLAAGNSKFVLKYGDLIVLDVFGYDCYTNIDNKDILVKCTTYTDTMKKIKNITFDDLKILGGSEVGLTNSLVYYGEYKNDITQLLSKKGIYQVEINLHHENIYSYLCFIIDLK